MRRSIPQMVKACDCQSGLVNHKVDIASRSPGCGHRCARTLCPKESVSRVEASHSHPMFLKRKRSFPKGCQSLSSARLESIHQRHGPYPTKAPNSSCRSVIDLTRVVTDRFSRRATWSIIRLVKHTNGVWLSQKRLLSVLTVNTVSL